MANKIVYQRDVPCKCGCKYATQVHRKEDIAGGDHINKVSLKCIRCGTEQLKQKIRTYKATEDIRSVVLDPITLAKETGKNLTRSGPIKKNNNHRKAS